MYEKKTYNVEEIDYNNLKAIRCNIYWKECPEKLEYDNIITFYDTKDCKEDSEVLFSICTPDKRKGLRDLLYLSSPEDFVITEITELFYYDNTTDKLSVEKNDNTTDNSSVEKSYSLNDKEDINKIFMCMANYLNDASLDEKAKYMKEIIYTGLFNDAIGKLDSINVNIKVREEY